MATCPAGNVFSQHVHLINLTRSLVAARFLAIEVVAFGEVEGHNEAGHVHYLSLQPALDEILNLETQRHPRAADVIRAWSLVAPHLVVAPHFVLVHHTSS